MWKFLTDIIDKFLADPKKFLHFGLNLLVLAALGTLLLLAISIPFFLIYRIDPVVFFQSKLRTGQIGLLDYAHKSAEFTDDRVRLLETAQSNILYVGTVFYRTPKEYETTLIDAINRGVRVRFLVADPDGEYFGANASFFGDTARGLRGEADDTFEGYLKIKSRVESESGGNGSIELRVVDRVFPSAMYFYDAQTANGRMILVARDFDRNAPEMPAFKFASVAGGVIDRYFRSAEELWNEATPYEDWASNGHNGAN